MQRQVKIDKIYLETHRDLILVDEPTIAQLKRFFAAQACEPPAGLRLRSREKPVPDVLLHQYRASGESREIVEHTARLFDEVILDDFFFTNCKCESCIKARAR